jgi:hypothetical protein
MFGSRMEINLVDNKVIPAKIIKYRFIEQILNHLTRINISKLFDKFTKNRLNLLYVYWSEEILAKLIGDT